MMRLLASTVPALFAAITSTLQARLFGPMNPSPNDRAPVSAIAFFLR